MTEPSTENIALPLEDPGKPEASTREEPTGRSWPRTLLMVASLFGLGAVSGMYLRVLVPPALLELVGLEQTRSPGGSRLEDSPPSVEATAPEVVALGRLVPLGGTVAVAFPSGAGDARISRLTVSEGDQVEADEIVAELDNLMALRAAKSLAEANVAVQEATLQQVRDSMLASLAEARANHAAAKVTLTLANQELDRQTRLVATNATTKVLLEQARANAAKAEADLQRTVALVDRYGGAETGRQSDIELAARNLERARADLTRAIADCASARVAAPRAGTVLSIHARVGEKPSDDGIMTIGDITRMTAELEVYQADVAKVALGQIVSLTAKALPDPLKGKVTEIRRIVGRQSVMSTEPAANADARVVLVTVVLDAASSAASSSYTHLEVVGRIRTKAE